MSFFRIKKKPVVKRKKGTKSTKLEWQKDSDIQSQMEKVIKAIGFVKKYVL